MNNTGPRTDRTGRNISSLAAPFKKVLLSFADGDISYADAQSDLQRLLASGASPADLREVMRRCESMEPLPDYAHTELLRVLDVAPEPVATPKPGTDAVPAQPAEQKSRGFEPVAAVPEVRATAEQAAAAPAEVSRSLPARAVPRAAAAAPRTAESTPSLSDRTRALEARVVRQKSEYIDLTHAYERARDAGSAAAARAIAVTAELAAVRGTLAEEQGRSQEARRALAEAVASTAAVRDLLAARDAARDAVRDAALESLRREADERDTRMAARHEAELLAERKATTDARAALAETGAAVEAARARAETGERSSAQHREELRLLQEALAARDLTLAQARKTLEARDAQLAALQREHAQSIAALETRVAALAAEVASTQAAHELGQRKARDNERALAEKIAAADAARAQSETTRREHAAAVGALEARANALEGELRAARAKSAAAAAAAVVAAPPAPVAVTPVPAPLWEPSPPAAAAPPAPEAQLVPAYWEPAPVAPIAPVAPARTAGRLTGFSPPAVARRWMAAANPRAAGVGVAIVLLLLVLILWLIGHRAPVPVAPPVAAATRAAEVPAAGTVIHDCSTCPALTVVPAGRFKQGSLRAESVSAAFEKPLHWVAIAHPFAMSTNDVSVDEFRAFISATSRNLSGCEIYDDKWHLRPDASWESPGFPQTGTHPVTCVSWEDATAYAKWLSTTTGHRYRLPSAAEWEYAARAGREAVQPWSTDGVGACASANVADQRAARKYPGWAVFPCNDGYVYTSPGGTYKANAFGLNDMLGNVFQWTDDCWNVDYTGAPTDGVARTSGDCAERELRGGSWFTTPNFVRTTYRNHFGVSYRASTLGIRLVRDLT